MPYQIEIPFKPNDKVFKIEDDAIETYVVNSLHVLTNLDLLATIRSVKQHDSPFGSIPRSEDVVSCQIGRDVYLTLEDAIEELRRRRKDATERK